MRFVFVFLFLTSCVHTPSASPSLSPPTQPTSPYVRKDWGRWIDEDKDCQNTRHEVLLRHSQRPAKLSKDGCKVIEGEWQDFYTGEPVTDPKQLQIDHVVPVKLAHEHSGHQWDKKTRNQFYNDFDNLVVATSKNNQSKGAHDITYWQPSDKTRACNQAKIWAKVKAKWGLWIPPAERETLNLLRQHG
jgi:hypothetical protein